MWLFGSIANQLKALWAKYTSERRYLRNRQRLTAKPNYYKEVVSGDIFYRKVFTDCAIVIPSDGQVYECVLNKCDIYVGTHHAGWKEGDVVIPGQSPENNIFCAASSSTREFLRPQLLRMGIKAL
jgi:hypothetical protein